MPIVLPATTTRVTNTRTLLALEACLGLLKKWRSNPPLLLHFKQIDIQPLFEDVVDEKKSAPPSIGALL
jgi:hypothetical protein